MARKSVTPWKRGDPIPGSVEDHPMASLQKAVNQLFDDFFMSYELMPLTSFEEPCIFTPKINMSDDGQAITVTVELPGLNLADIEVHYDRDTLIVQGHKKEEDQRGGLGSYCMERLYGDFKRVIPLPSGIDAGNIHAAYRNGVLTVVLPRMSGKKPQKKITIKGMG